MRTLGYLDQLPKIPEHLITNCYEVIKQPDELPLFGFDDYPNYKFMSIPEKSELEAWLLDSLKIKRHRIFHIHVMENSILMHKDWPRNYSLNYILTTGGENVLTHFHTEEGEIFESYNIEQFRWHHLNSQCFHSVSGFTPGVKRVALVLGMDYPYGQGN